MGTKKFKRFQSDRFNRVSESWRKPRGIDGRVRRKFKGTMLMPNVGYGSNKKTRHMAPNGFYNFLVRTPSDVEMLLMHNQKYSVTLAHNLSAKTRRAVIERCDQMGLNVTNRKARMTTEEAE